MGVPNNTKPAKMGTAHRHWFSTTVGAALGFLIAFSPARATTLTFEPLTSTTSSPIDQAYGDRVTSTSQGGFTYGEGGEGFTPNVVADYGPAFRWPDRYGDLVDVLFVFPETEVFSVTLTADAGFQVLLYDFDMAGFPQVDYTIDSVQVQDETATLLFDQTNAFIAGAGPSHTDFDFASPLVGQALTISFDSRNLADLNTHIGIDNIRFGQCAVGQCPESSTILFDTHPPTTHGSDALRSNLPAPESSQQIASSFQLPFDANLTEIAWSGYYFGGSLPASPPTVDFTVRLFAGDTPPVDPFFSELIPASFAQTGTTTGIGNTSGHPIYQFSITLDSPIPLSGDTTYWLSVLDSDASTTIDFRWLFAANSFDSLTTSRGFEGQSWAIPGFRASTFTLSGDVAGPQTCTQPPSGLVSWWPGDGNANDIQDGNDGTLQNGAAFAPGKVGQAFSFDGVDDYVSITHNDNLNVTSHTIEAWIRPPDFVPSTFATILSKTTPAPVERTFGLFIEPSFVPFPLTPGALLGDFTNGPNNFNSSRGNTVVTDGNFHHVAVTYDAPSGTMRLYLDGNLDVETMFTPGTLPDTHTIPASIGAEFSGIGSNARLFFNGLIDELGLYNRALSQTEIQAIFVAGSAGKCKVQAPPASPTVDLVAACDTGVSNTDNITNDTTPTFAGTAPPESTVELSSDGVSLGTNAADATGAWSLTTALDEGMHTITATATDAIGNVSDPSAPLSVTVDTTAPTITASHTPEPNANGWNNTDVIVSFECTDALSGLAGTPPAPTTVSTEGAHTVTGSCEDVAGNTAQATTEVNIDKTPPQILGLPVFGCTLWPPNHKLVQVAMVIPSDGLSGLATESLTAVSDEPEDGKGDGHTSPDIVIDGASVALRAERSGAGDGRVYTITAFASDLAGNATTATATCEVPHDRGKGKKKNKQKKQHKRK
jgi:hypothetical protein